MSLGITGFLNLLKQQAPSKAKLQVTNVHGTVIGYVDLLKNKPWLDWFNSIMGLGRQVFVTGPLAFGLVPAQQSATLTMTFTIGGVFVPKASFAVAHAEPLPPDNTCVTADVFADNRVAIRFNNYSAAGVNPGTINFDVLITIPAIQ